MCKGVTQGEQICEFNQSEKGEDVGWSNTEKESEVVMGIDLRIKAVWVNI